jgi:hypothetical protein
VTAWKDQEGKERLGLVASEVAASEVTVNA